MVALGFDFLLSLNSTLVGDCVASYAEIDYIAGPLLPISEQVGVAVMYRQRNLAFLPFLQRLITISVINLRTTMLADKFG
jgi:hypothetical protein